MTKVFFLFILFQINNFYSQTFTTERRYPTSEFSSIIKDTSDFVVLYNVTTSDGKNKKSSAQTLLQIGKRFSKFIDINTIKRDSLLKEHSKLETVGAKELNNLSKYNVIYKKNVLKDLQTNAIFVQERISKNVYQYQEGIPKLNWMLTKDKMNLLGYQCKSAKLNFRGRNYLAWYTDEIPKSNGPYIFGGLPGLILKISDEDGIYEFTAVGIEKKKMDIYFRDEKTIHQVSRDDFRKIQRNYFENPSLFMQGKAYDETGKEIPPQTVTRHYTPLELE